MAADFKKLLKKAPVELLILLTTLALYIIALQIFKSPDTEFIPLILGILIVIELAYFIWLEIKDGVKKHGWKHEVVDTLVAVFIAVLLWIGASVILNTSTPISAVASCSMLPNLERGDFIVVQGAEVNAYEISMSEEELQEITNGPFTVTSGGESVDLPLSVYYYCQSRPSEELCRAFWDKPESVVEKAGPFTYHYGLCEIDDFARGIKGYGTCLKYVEFEGKDYYPSLSNDIIVYAPREDDLYWFVVRADIVHRVFFKVDVEGETYYLTKGDNNPTMDVQATDAATLIKNHPVAEENVKGKVIGRVPYLGHLKLLIMGQWKEDEQCGWQLSYSMAD